MTGGLVSPTSNSQRKYIILKLSVYSHQAKAKAKKGQRRSEKDRRLNGQHQRNLSLWRLAFAWSEHSL